MRITLTLAILLFAFIISTPLRADLLGLHLYDPAQDQTAQRLLTAHSNASPAKVLSLEDQRFEVYNQRRSDFRQLKAMTERNLEIHSLLSSIDTGQKALCDRIMTSLSNCIGTVAPDAAKAASYTYTASQGEQQKTDWFRLPDTYQDLRSALALLDMYAAQFKLFTGKDATPFDPATDPPALDPGSLKGADQETKTNAPSIYNDYSNQWVAVKRKIDGFTQGTAGNARADWLIFLHQRSEDTVTADAQQKNIEELQKGLTAITQNSAANLTKVFEAFTNLTHSISNFSVFSATNLTAHYKYCTLSILALQDALQALATGSAPTKPNATNVSIVKGIAILSATSNLLSSASQLQAALHHPPLASLRIQLAIMQAELAETQQRMALETARIGFAQDAFLATVEEANMLWDCRGRWNHHTSSDPNSSILEALSQERIRDLLQDEHYKDPERQGQVYAIILIYLDSIRIARTKQQLATERIYLTYLDESRLVDGSALALWDALITEPLYQIAVYCHGGFTQQQIASILVDALGFSAVAWRAGK